MGMGGQTPIRVVSRVNKGEGRQLSRFCIPLEVICIPPQFGQLAWLPRVHEKQVGRDVLHVESKHGWSDAEANRKADL